MSILSFLKMAAISAMSDTEMEWFYIKQAASEDK